MFHATVLQRIRRLVSGIMLVVLLLPGGVFASMQRTPVIVADVVAQTDQTSVESTDVDAEGKKDRIEKIMRQGKQRLKS